ncbi:Hha/YmoA family nucleoid-associated regulatory protein [Citrobacter braakii]|uniref:Hha/YmoA family nucleoid-associated regulatory protein n=1 Tax=Citrobacter braakii TaxID=57706 RepID=UPI00351D1D7A
MRELEIFINQNFDRLSEYEQEYFNAAADHRRVELTMERLYDRVPASVQKRVIQMLPDLRG